MKKLFRTLVAVVTICTTMVFSSCKEEPENQQPTPINVSVETPRSIAQVDGNLYITCYYPQSVIRFDMAQQAVTGICNLGSFHPEGIAAVGNKLYIASSNISDESFNYHYDNKLYIVDIESFKIVDSVTVGINPSKVKKLDNNHIVFNTLGDYETDFGGLWVMNTNSKEITAVSTNLYNFDVYSGDIYGYTSPYGTLGFYKINGSTLEATELGIQWNATDNPYGINVNPNNGNIIVLSDGNYTASGDCYVYSNNGDVRMNAVQLGNLPSKAVAVSGDDIIVLNEGNWGGNNAGVSRVNASTSTASANYFEDANGRGLGDVAQDIIIANGKAYITVSFSNSIEVMDVATGKSTRFPTK